MVMLFYQQIMAIRVQNTKVVKTEQSFYVKNKIKELFKEN